MWILTLRKTKLICTLYKNLVRTLPKTLLHYKYQAASAVKRVSRHLFLGLHGAIKNNV